MTERAARWLLLLATIFFATLGQLYFAKRSQFFWDGVILYAIAIVCLLLLTRERTAGAETARAPAPRRTLEDWARIALASVGAMLAAFVVLSLRAPRESYWPLFWLWLAAITSFLLATLPPWAELRPAARAFWRGVRWREVWLVLILVIGAFALRAWRIDSIPWTLGGDEGSQGLWARDVIAGRLPNMFGLGWLSVPNMSFYWQAGWFHLVGDSVAGLRLPWAVVGAATVGGLYLLVRRLFDPAHAILAAVLLTTYHFHIHYSRLGSNQIADPLFTVFALYFMVVGLQSRREWPWAVSGVIAGLAFYFYAGSRQVPVILIAVLVSITLTDLAALRQRSRGLLAMLAAFLITVGPMLLVYVQSPNDFNARVNEVGILQNGWVALVAQQTGQSTVAILLEQMRKAFLAFNLTTDRVVWYGASIPLLQFAASILFVLGAAFSVSRLRHWRYALFVIWFALVIFIGGALTENPPSSQRLVSSAAPVAFFLAVALIELTRVVQSLLGAPRLLRAALAAAAAIAISVVSLNFYFGPYQRSWVYGGLNAEVATSRGYYLRNLGPGHQEYFFGAPRMWADFGSTPFIAADTPIYDVKEPFAGTLNFVDPASTSVFVFLPERISELDAIRQLLPGGVVEEVRRIPGDWERPLLFTAYRVEPLNLSAEISE